LGKITQVLKNLSEKIADIIVENPKVNKENRAFYAYGLRQGMFMILNLLTVIIIGLLLKMLWQGVLFTILYIPLRSYAGGFHCKTKLGCYIFSVFQLAISLSALKILPFHTFFYGLVLIWSSLGVFFMSPTPDKNKPLNREEMLTYRGYAMGLMSLELFIANILWCFHLYEFYALTTIVMLNIAVLLLLGSAKNGRISGYKDCES
jgi:accessory gene regulator B